MLQESLLPVPAVGAPCPDLSGVPAVAALFASCSSPVLLSFAAGDWNPATNESLTVYRRLLAATLKTEMSVVAVEHHGGQCLMMLDDRDGGESLDFPVVDLSRMDATLAARFGVAGKEALFVIDNGRIRWSYVGAPGRRPSLAALTRSLEPLVPPARPLADGASSPSPSLALNRRQFAAAALAAAALAAAGAESTGTARAATASDVRVAEDIAVRLRVNGADHELRLDPRVTLLDALRDHLDLTGSKKGCDHGQCGACTVLVDGRRINSCLTLAVMHSGTEIRTIEGLANGDNLHPMQAAFLEHDGFQCGYCTPGQIMSAIGLMAEPCGDSPAQVRECMSGNICRCGAYPNIVAAIRKVRQDNPRGRRGTL